MRKLAGVLFAATMLLPLALASSPSGAAATGTTCKPPSGKITLSPGLSATPKVQVITINLPVSGCVGGGVTSGVFKGSLKTAAISTATFAKPSAPLKLTATITWNTKKTSTVAATSSTKVAKTITSTVAGKISKGVFVGLTFKSSQVVTLGPVVGGIIKTLNIKGSGSVTIR
jgi:hypothetical protein